MAWSRPSRRSTRPSTPSPTRWRRGSPPATAWCSSRPLPRHSRPGWLNLVYGGGGDVGRWLLENQEVRYYAFTGSTEAGRAIQRAAGLRRSQLELGNISATIVCADADLERAVAKCAAIAFRKAGQVCTSLQRLFVHEDVIEPFAAKLVVAAEAMTVGDPRDPATVVGPMIDVREADRWGYGYPPPAGHRATRSRSRARGSLGAGSGGRGRAGADRRPA